MGFVGLSLSKFPNSREISLISGALIPIAENGITKLPLGVRNCRKEILRWILIPVFANPGEKTVCDSCLGIEDSTDLVCKKRVTNSVAGCTCETK